MCAPMCACTASSPTAASCPTSSPSVRPGASWCAPRIPSTGRSLRPRAGLCAGGGAGDRHRGRDQPHHHRLQHALQPHAQPADRRELRRRWASRWTPSHCDNGRFDRLRQRQPGRSRRPGSSVKTHPAGIPWHSPTVTQGAGAEMGLKRHDRQRLHLAGVVIDLLSDPAVLAQVRPTSRRRAIATPNVTPQETRIAFIRLSVTSVSHSILRRDER